MSDEDIYSLNGINSQWTLLELLKHHLVQYVSITNITSITCRYISVISFWLTLFYFITGPHVWSQFFPILTKLYIITLFCIPLYFYFAFTSFSFSLLSLSWNFMVFSAHESRSVPNILIQSRSTFSSSSIIYIFFSQRGAIKCYRNTAANFLYWHKYI